MGPVRHMIPVRTVRCGNSASAFFFRSSGFFPSGLHCGWFFSSETLPLRHFKATELRKQGCKCSAPWRIAARWRGEKLGKFGETGCCLGGHPSLISGKLQLKFSQKERKMRPPWRVKSVKKSDRSESGMCKNKWKMWRICSVFLFLKKNL